MASLKDNKTCALLEQYLNYLIVIKGHRPLTAEEYRVDCCMLSEYVKRRRGLAEEEIARRDFSDVDIDFIKSITVGDMYDFISYGIGFLVPVAVLILHDTGAFLIVDKAIGERPAVNIGEVWVS